MERLARAVKLASKIHEESYDIKAAEEAVNNNINMMVDFKTFYRKSLQEASDEAAEIEGFDTRGTKPIYLLLNLAWNDILDWAKQFD